MSSGSLDCGRGSPGHELMQLLLVLLVLSGNGVLGLLLHGLDKVLHVLEGVDLQGDRGPKPTLSRKDTTEIQGEDPTGQKIGYAAWRELGYSRMFIIYSHVCFPLPTLIITLISPGKPTCLTDPGYNSDEAI